MKRSPEKQFPPSHETLARSPTRCVSPIPTLPSPIGIRFCNPTQSNCGFSHQFHQIGAIAAQFLTPRPTKSAKNNAFRQALGQSGKDASPRCVSHPRNLPSPIGIHIIESTQSNRWGCGLCRLVLPEHRKSINQKKWKSKEGKRPWCRSVGRRSMEAACSCGKWGCQMERLVHGGEVKGISSSSEIQKRGVGDKGLRSMPKRKLAGNCDSVSLGVRGSRGRSLRCVYSYLSGMCVHNRKDGKEEGERCTYSDGENDGGVYHC